MEFILVGQPPAPGEMVLPCSMDWWEAYKDLRAKFQAESPVLAPEAR